ncbi:MAG: sensor histidine kinase [Flavobacteriales bacterium]|nr:sensor histidine kinase [Flavobacteriales bacterium]MCB9166568.1 sensor histidine kinase [Flavobacteriales bacterium]
MDNLSYRIWPIIATLLAVLFISFDLFLVNEARKVQMRMAAEVELLDALADMDRALHQLGLVHRVDLHTGQHNWERDLGELMEHMRSIHDRYAGEPGVQALPENFIHALVQADSLHRDASIFGEDAQAHARDAVLQLMLRNAGKAIERTERLVHERGLSIHSNQLSRRWDEAQVLMFLSCLMAVVFALLVGMNRRLLFESRRQGDQLVMAKRDLELTNRELRETMLSKEEKEVMLKEIHHRVKNNLQIVKSLIRFQLDQVDDPKVRELFNECITRVSAMALVHEQSYLSKDLANIDVGAYLDHLVRDIIHAYTIDTRLRMDIAIEVRTLGVDTLIPLGLLINEVISNALKYAFRDREEGTLIVHLKGDEPDGFDLRIGDDGVGMPDKNKWERPNSLGMELIHTLADQLNATIELLPTNGTLYRLSTRAGHAQRRA